LQATLPAIATATSQRTDRTPRRPSPRSAGKLFNGSKSREGGRSRWARRPVSFSDRTKEAGETAPHLGMYPPSAARGRGTAHAEIETLQFFLAHCDQLRAHPFGSQATPRRANRTSLLRRNRTFSLCCYREKSDNSGSVLSLLGSSMPGA
jgi:hypothetical protein